MENATERRIRRRGGSGRHRRCQAHHRFSISLNIRTVTMTQLDTLSPAYDFFESASDDTGAGDKIAEGSGVEREFLGVRGGYGIWGEGRVEGGTLLVDGFKDGFGFGEGFFAGPRIRGRCGVGGYAGWG